MKNICHNRRKLLKAGAASAAAVLLPINAFAAKHNYGIVGTKAPELEISDWIDGAGKPTSFKLADHRGKFVFMEFWQSWCPGCHAHGFPTLKKISDAFKANEHFTAVAIQTTFEGHTVNTSDKMREIQNAIILISFLDMMQVTRNLTDIQKPWWTIVRVARLGQY